MFERKIKYTTKSDILSKKYYKLVCSILFFVYILSLLRYLLLVSLDNTLLKLEILVRIIFFSWVRRFCRHQRALLHAVDEIGNLGVLVRVVSVCVHSKRKSKTKGAQHRAKRTMHYNERKLQCS